MIAILLFYGCIRLHSAFMYTTIKFTNNWFSQLVLSVLAQKNGITQLYFCKTHLSIISCIREVLFRKLYLIKNFILWLGCMAADTLCSVFLA